MTATPPAVQKPSPRNFLRHRPELWATPLPAAPADQLTNERLRSAEERLVVTTWNRVGGLLGALCLELGIEPGMAVAVLCAESSGRGFAPDGRLVIRFEVHVFWKLWGARTVANRAMFRHYFLFEEKHRWLGHEFCPAPGNAWEPVHQNQDSEWQALGVARTLEDTTALCSTSMGGPQLIGFHHQRIGYSRVQEMFAAFRDSPQGERAQILGLFDFFRGDSVMLQALRGNDVLAFARRYNGPGQAGVYAARITSFSEIFCRLRKLACGRLDAHRRADG